MVQDETQPEGWGTVADRVADELADDDLGGEGVFLPDVPGFQLPSGRGTGQGRRLLLRGQGQDQDPIGGEGPDAGQQQELLGFMAVPQRVRDPVAHVLERLVHPFGEEWAHQAGRRQQVLVAECEDASLGELDRGRGKRGA
nr:hypothetical protein [Streptomyces sp. Ag109_O5-1]